MKCKRCGYRGVTPQDRYCSACGALLWDVIVPDKFIFSDNKIRPVVMELRDERAGYLGKLEPIEAVLKLGNREIKLFFRFENGVWTIEGQDRELTMLKSRVNGELVIRLIRRVADEVPVEVEKIIPVTLTRHVVMHLGNEEDTVAGIGERIDVWGSKGHENEIRWDPHVRTLTSWKISTEPPDVIRDFENIMTSVSVNGQPPEKAYVSLDPGSGNARLWTIHDVHTGENSLQIRYNTSGGEETVSRNFQVKPPIGTNAANYYLALDLGNSTITVAIYTTPGGNIDLPLKPWMNSLISFNPFSDLIFEYRDGMLQRVNFDYDIPLVPPRIGVGVNVDNARGDFKYDYYQKGLKGQYDEYDIRVMEVLAFEAVRRALTYYWKKQGVGFAGRLEAVGLSVPTMWNKFLIEGIKDAVYNALHLLGLKNLEISIFREGDAPFYAIAPASSDDYYVVWDMGGSTTDISLYCLNNDKSELLAWAGALWGGHSVDIQIEKELRKLGRRTALLTRITSLKETFSSTPEVFEEQGFLDQEQLDLFISALNSIKREAWNYVNILVENLIETAESDKIIPNKKWNLIISGNASKLRFHPNTDSEPYGIDNFKDLVRKAFVNYLQKQNLISDENDVVIAPYPDSADEKSITVIGIARLTATFRGQRLKSMEERLLWTLVYVPEHGPKKPEIILRKGVSLPAKVILPVEGRLWVILDDRWTINESITRIPEYGFAFTDLDRGEYIVSLQDGELIIKNVERSNEDAKSDDIFDR